VHQVAIIEMMEAAPGDFLGANSFAEEGNAGAAGIKVVAGGIFFSVGGHFHENLVLKSCE
jgi:hypothetical protein